MTKRLSGLMAAVVLLATAVIGLSTPSAQAAYCTDGGVGAVVDFGDLGGGVSTGCGTGSRASAAFTSAGVNLETDPKNPGFVCRVQGKPGSGDQCMATDAYWALFVSRQGAAWAYASQGVYTQTVKDGDTVAFVWQSSNSRTTPGTAPQPPAAAPTQPASTAKAPTKAATKRPTTTTAKATPTKRPHPASTPSSRGSTTPSDAPTSIAPASTAATPTTSPSAAAPPAGRTISATAVPETSDLAAAASGAASADDDGGGLPAWVGPAAIVLLVAVAGGVTLWRKKTP